MGGTEIRSLKVSDYLKAHSIDFDNDTDVLEAVSQIDESQIPTWHIKRVKNGMPYYTFSSPESIKEINSF